MDIFDFAFSWCRFAFSFFDFFYSHFYGIMTCFRKIMKFFWTICVFMGSSVKESVSFSSDSPCSIEQDASNGIFTGCLMWPHLFPLRASQIFKTILPSQLK